MGAIRQLIDTLARIFGVHLAPWMAPAGLAIIVILLSPWIIANVRSDEARKLLVKAGRESGGERQRLEQEALALARRSSASLLAFAQEAVTQGRRDLAEQVLGELEAARAHPVEVARLRATLRGPAPPTALDAILLVERLIENGMFDQAERRLAEARERWPQDGELVALADTLSERRAGRAGSPDAG